MKEKLLLLRNQLKMGHRISFAEAMLLQRAIDILVNKAGNPPAQSDCCPAQNHVSPEQGGDTSAQRHGWIPLSEQMPESNGVYFGWDGKRVLEVNCFFGGFSANQFIHGEITHWMPLPAAPQEVK
ncbi:DUF551 domain-containing protein [Klebsiella pneumoniae]